MTCVASERLTDIMVIKSLWCHVNGTCMHNACRDVCIFLDRIRKWHEKYSKCHEKSIYDYCEAGGELGRSVVEVPDAKKRLKISYCELFQFSRKRRRGVKEHGRSTYWFKNSRDCFCWIGNGGEVMRSAVGRSTYTIGLINPTPNCFSWTGKGVSTLGNL